MSPNLLFHARSIPQLAGRFAIALGSALCLLLWSSPSQTATTPASQSPGETFKQAWDAARSGDRSRFEQLMPGLQGYQLYPYLEYEDLRYRRASVPPERMAKFIDNHQDFPFTRGLRDSWLRALGKKGDWDSLLQFAGDSSNTEVQCYLATARIERGQTDGLLPVAQELWTVGKSQPDACDPVFNWLRKQGGISSGLAWERIRRAMEARQARLTQYLARYVDASDQVWVRRWQEQERGGYYRLNEARQWSDQEKGRTITEFGLRRLARSHPGRAQEVFDDLRDRFSWSETQRAGILYQIALWSAVEREPETPRRMRAVPEEFRDGRLYEWWARFELAAENWADLVLVIDGMTPELKQDSRWRYWDARARLMVGDQDYPMGLLRELSAEASYYGFLAADVLDAPYSICPLAPEVAPAEIQQLRARPGFSRSLELHRLGIRNWSRSEWQMATRDLDRQGLRAAAAVATEEGWPDMAIFALGNSGDLQWYDWRFPLDYSELVSRYAQATGLDASWVLGLMRSESAMAPDARSSAGALGLMQLMPDTARQLARRHHLPYAGSQSLVKPAENVQLGTLYLSEVLDKFNRNPVLATGAYNAGPRAVERFLKERSSDDPEVWIETLPYYETRDYIPRVLAFTTIYDWMREQPVTRVSSRMPAINSGTLDTARQGQRTTEVICQAPG